MSKADKCPDPDYRNAVNDMANIVKKNYDKRDVSLEVRSIEIIIQNCNFNISDFGWKKSDLEEWKNKGYNAEIANIQEQIKHYAKYRDVSPEVEKFKQYAEKLKISTESAVKYYSPYLAQGKKSGASEEQKCQPNIDLRNEILGDVRDQDSVGWCYAFAAADLLTYKLGKKISAADLAINDDKYKHQLEWTLGLGKPDFEDGGIEFNAINSVKLKKGGVCLEENFKSEDNEYSNIYNTLAEIEGSSKIINFAQRNCVKPAQALFPSLNISEIQQASYKANGEELVKLLSDKACKPRINIYNIHVKRKEIYSASQQELLFDDINLQLSEKNKNIVSIAFNSGVLFDRNKNDKNDKNKKIYGGHASVLVGRRYNKENGECEYLVRNSFGRGCEKYDKYYQCDQGHIWVPKSVLVKSIVAITYVE